MPNTYFQFRQFTIHQEKCAMKVTTDGCLFGAWAATRIALKGPGARCLDIGAGTGLTSLMIAQKNPNLQIDAIEIEGDAAAQARQNILDSPWAGIISVHHADIHHFPPSQAYDFIASNPPFYENELKSGNALRKLAHHEGLGLQSLLRIIRTRLATRGRFFLLLPFKRLGEFQRLASRSQLAIEEEVHVRQSPAHSFFRALIQGKHAPDQAGESEPAAVISQMSILDHNQEYTKEFRNLLGDYYLRGMGDGR